MLHLMINCFTERLNDESAVSFISSRVIAGGFHHRKLRTHHEQGLNLYWMWTQVIIRDRPQILRLMFSEFKRIN